MRYIWTRHVRRFVVCVVQGVPLELTVEGVAAVAALLAELTADPRVGPARLVALDIGGGLPVQYDSDDLMWLLGEQQLAVDGTGAAARTGEAGRDRLSQGHGLSIFERYARMLRERVPQLFESSEGVLGSGQGQQKQQHPRVQLMTEFGRCVVAKAAFAAGRVQYTKWCGGRHVVVSGLGGDLLLRAVYLPDTWPVRVELCSALGEPMAAAAAPAASLPAAPAAAAAATDGPSSAQNQQQGRGCSGGDGEGGEQGCGEAGPRGGAVVPTGGVVGGPQAVPTDVVGPLCFQGDRLAEAAPLPAAQPGDWVVVPDVGAYTLSMFCRWEDRGRVGNKKRMAVGSRAYVAHWHWCHNWPLAWCRSDSSPHVPALLEVAGYQGHRFTPAPAGTTAVARRRCGVFGAHAQTGRSAVQWAAQRQGRARDSGLSCRLSGISGEAPWAGVGRQGSRGKRRRRQGVRGSWSLCC